MVRRIEPYLVSRDRVDAVWIVNNAASLAVSLQRCRARHQPSIYGESGLRETNNIAFRCEDQLSDASCGAWAATAPQIATLASKKRNRRR